ncbi:hypothetical protein RND81_08G203900 [Saponaria officinalis]
MICCFSLPALSTFDSAVAQAVSLVSSEMHVFGAFELVVVVKTSSDDVSAVNDFMSCFPSFCLTIPYADCGKICEFLDFSPGSEPVGVLVNRNHSVEWHKSLDVLLEYGVDGFPFTPERLARITEREQNCTLWRKWSMVSLFLSSTLVPYPKPRSLIRRNPGGGPGKEEIESFNSKSCVGLYLCSTGNLIPTLDEIHKNCRDLGLEFDVILVYMPFKDFVDPKLFQDRINSILEERKISWWVLPFVYWVSRRLWRLCHKDTEDRLIIVDPNESFVEAHGEAVIRHFGMHAYPFSRRRMIDREVERLRDITLESLLVYRSRDYVIGMDSCSRHVPVASLEGKNVILYLGYVGHQYDELYDQLSTGYCQMKARDPDLEVVFVGLNIKSLCDFGSVCAMPWLVCAYDPDHADLVSKQIFRYGGKRSTLVAFGNDGRIRSVCAQRAIWSFDPDSVFNDNLRWEIFAELFGNHPLPQCCL